MSCGETGPCADPFGHMDADKDGFITYEELHNFVSKRRNYADQKVLKVIFNSVDADKNNKIDKQEFEKFRTAMFPVDPNASHFGYRVLFRLMDEDGDGNLDKKEIKNFFDANGKTDLFDYDKLTKEADTDGDGKISLDEFLSFVAS
ncbi:Calcium-binding protein [Entamoeba marina]